MIEDLVRRCMSMIDILCDYTEMSGEMIEDGDKEYICSKAKEAKKLLEELVK